MPSANILIVEDDDDMFEAYADSLGDLELGNLEINLTREKAADSAVSSLLSGKFDGAIIDLNLDQTTPMEAGGNKVLKEILKRHRFPVIVVSGNLQNLDPTIREHKSEFLKFMNRETANSDIFNHLIKIYQTGITNILGGKGLIEQQLGEIFWNHLSSNIHDFPTDGEASGKILLRYIASHLSEYLDIPDTENDYYHEAEFYIKPPIRKHISTGDIVKEGDLRYLVLSPACDVAVRDAGQEDIKINSNKILLSPIIDIEKSVFIQHSIIKANSNSRERTAVLSDIIKGKREKYGFLPKYGSMNPAVVDFQNIRTVDLAEFLNFERIATVAAMFMKDIQSRFASYLARQGQPDLDKQKLLDEYKVLLAD